MTTETYTRQISLDQGEHTSISFQPGGPQVVIRAKSKTPETNPSEPLVGYSISLTPYGGASHVAVARYELKTGAASLTYPATVRHGLPTILHGWTCEVRNECSEQIVVELSIASIATETVSFDMPLLNLVLAEVLQIANLKVHLHSNDTPGAEDSYLTWSDAITNFLQHSGYAGKTGFEFPFETIDVDRVHVTLDADGAPSSLDLHDDGAGPTLRVVAQLAGTGALPIVSGLIEWCTTTVEIKLSDASLEVACKARVLASVGNASIDISNRVESKISSAVQSRAAPYRPLAKVQIDSFFSQLLRLEPVQLVLGYSTVETALQVRAGLKPFLLETLAAAVVQP